MKLLSGLLLSLFILNNCTMLNKSESYDLTTSAEGHTLHHNGVFSPDGEWIVFDGRNDDTKIGETSVISVVNVSSREEKMIYKTTNQSVYGPGVGAASYSPTEDKVIFIHGLPNADAEKPYVITRRTGVGIKTKEPNQPFYYDARDTTPPFTQGSLRGGTHSHCWSGDGKLISFTYNDELVDPDLRTVGVMVPYKNGVQVDATEGNNDGIMYSSIVTEVVQSPQPGSDDINKAFDECWVGKNGYTDKFGNHIPYTIAFQGNTLNKAGKVITEIFIIEIDIEKVLNDKNAIGEFGERPKVPFGIKQKRLSFTEKGLSDTRHWLRSSPDGKTIYALAKDDNGVNQIIKVDINSGKVNFVTQNNHSINYPFNVSNDGEKVCYVADNKLFIFNINKKKEEQLKINQEDGKLVGAPSFSPKDNFIVFNQFVKNAEGNEFLQIRKIDLEKP